MLRIATSRTRPTAPKPCVRRRLGIERLEDRIALSGIPAVVPPLTHATPAARLLAPPHVATAGHDSHPGVAQHRATHPHHTTAPAHLPGSRGTAKPGTPAATAASGSIHALGAPTSGAGWVIAAINGAAQNDARATLVQPDGKIVAVGATTPTNAAQRFGITRFNADGSPDTTFSTNGQVSTAWTAADVGVKNVTPTARAIGAVLQPDGKLLVAGSVRWGSFYSPTTNLALARYNPDGSLDATFNKTGKVMTSFGGRNVDLSSIAGISLEAVNGATKIVVATFVNGGATGRDFAVARYNLDGSLDTSFGGTGRVTTDFAGKDDLAFGMVVQPDGKIVVGGGAQQLVNGALVDSFALARYNIDGSLDTSLGGTGKVTPMRVATDGTTGYMGSHGLALQPDGKFVTTAVSTSSTVDRYSAARFNADGSVDASFGVGGRFDLAAPGDGQAAAVAVQGNAALPNYGDIYLAGYSETQPATPPASMAVVRLTPGGQLDATFGSGGVASILVGPTGSGKAVALQPGDGKVVVAGISTDPTTSPSTTYFGVARFNTDGSADATF